MDRWTFSTSGVSIPGRYRIPCVGSGPGHEDQAHAPDELTWKRELMQAAVMYAVMPQAYAGPESRTGTDFHLTRRRREDSLPRGGMRERGFSA